MSTEVKAELKVNGHGNSNADIFFIGGFPGKADLLSGFALTGYNEITLNNFLYPLRLNLKNCYRTLFIKEKLEYSGNNPKKLREAIAKVDYQNYLEILFKEIKDVSPNILVPLDDVSLGAVFPHISNLHKPRGRSHWIYCYRGSVLPLRSDFSLLQFQEESQNPKNQINVIPTLSPFMLEVDYTARSYVSLDFKRIKDLAISTQEFKEPGLCWVAHTAREFEIFLDRNLANNPKRVTFDIETYGGLLTCISFCFDGYESCTVPLLDSSISKDELVI